MATGNDYWDGLSDRTKNNIIREKMGLPPGESDHDEVTVGNLTTTRADFERLWRGLSDEQKNLLVEQNSGHRRD